MSLQGLQAGAARPMCRGCSNPKVGVRPAPRARLLLAPARSGAGHRPLPSEGGDDGSSSESGGAPLASSQELQVLLQVIEKKFGDMEKNMEKKFGDMEKNMEKNMEKKFGDMEKNMEKKFGDMEKNLEKNMEKKFGEMEGRVVEVVENVEKQLAQLSRDLGGVAEGVVRLAHPGFPSRHVIATVEDLAAAVSTAAHPASPHALLAALVEGDCGYHALARVVLGRVEGEVPEVAQLAAAVAAAVSWEDKASSWGRLLNALEQQRQDAWWEATGRLLKHYCFTAASSPPADRPARLIIFLAKQRRSCQLALVMAVAVAAGELRLELELDGLAPPQLQPSFTSITLQLLEAKRNAGGVFEPVKQLRTAAQVLVWALHTGNPRLAALGAVEVEGIVGMTGGIPASRRRDWERLAASLVAVQLPGLPPATLRLRLSETPQSAGTPPPLHWSIASAPASAVVQAPSLRPRCSARWKTRELFQGAGDGEETCQFWSSLSQWVCLKKLDLDGPRRVQSFHASLASTCLDPQSHACGPEGSASMMCLFNRPLPICIMTQKQRQRTSKPCAGGPWTAGIVLAGEALDSRRPALFAVRRDFQRARSLPLPRAPSVLAHLSDAVFLGRTQEKCEAAGSLLQAWLEA